MCLYLCHLKDTGTNTLVLALPLVQWSRGFALGMRGFSPGRDYQRCNRTKIYKTDVVSLPGFSSFERPFRPLLEVHFVDFIIVPRSFTNM